MSILGKMYYWGEKAKHVPDQPGVYALYDEDQSLIYIGKSVNLRNEFASYLETDFSEDPCKRATKYYKREATSKHEDRAMELLEEYRQKHGRVPKCNSPIQQPKKEVSREEGFHFHKDVGKPLFKVAFNLQDFKTIISEAPVVSLEFHQRRGDFVNWIHHALKDEQLSKAVYSINKTGENLRGALLSLLNNGERASCPTCGSETSPVKTWKMAGRPSKTGERLELKIGHYTCQKCGKSFRRVLAKEKVKAS